MGVALLLMLVESAEVGWGKVYILTKLKHSVDGVIVFLRLRNLLAINYTDSYNN